MLISEIHKTHSDRTDTWITPPSIIRDLGPFDLDPCAAIRQPWPTADLMYTSLDDGLSQPWRGFVWMNPPYNRDKVDRWLDRLADHGNGIALIFARTETQTFFDHVWGKASSLRFIEGRVYFHYEDGERARNNAGGPSVLVGYGAEADQRLRNSEIPGYFLKC